MTHLALWQLFLTDDHRQVNEGGAPLRSLRMEERKTLEQIFASERFTPP
jgi:hypothetical protein